jgi:hypothetical protein
MDDDSNSTSYKHADADGNRDTDTYAPTNRGSNSGPNRSYCDLHSRSSFAE